MTNMRKLFARQLAKATDTEGKLDIDKLSELVVEAYEQSARDTNRTDRSMSLMIDELDKLNRELEQKIADRTAELKESEGRLQSQNELFHAAINNMSQALMMFDASGRLMISNRRYRDMYGLPEDAVRPGRSARELIEARIANRTLDVDVDRYLDVLYKVVDSGKPATRLVELPDGRTIAVLNTPMRGGGWVTTHEDITERRNTEKKIAHMARHDALTDLPNRTLLRERLTDALSGVHRGERLAVLYLDLDHFKSVNDTLGHTIGDELLKMVAKRLRHTVRDGDTVARVGGDEFAVITSAKNPTETAILARRLCEAIRAPYDLHGHAVITDTSIGIAMAPNDGTEPDGLIKNADMALYKAKGDGRGTYRFFESTMDSKMKERRSLELALRNAIANNEFELHYQPLLDLRINSVTTCEALLRWKHPERGLISPAEFIPIAEEIGLIVPIGEWVIRRACQDAASWSREIKVAVNLSPIQVMSQNLVPIVMSALASAGLPATRLDVEITESVLMQNTDTTLAALHRLREIGVSISMDDFGTGYSSLRYLRSFPFSKIKIDRCFISGLPACQESAAIVRAVAGMAKNLNVITTAEGVETEEQLLKIRELGCTEMQGYFFSRPITADAMGRFLAPAKKRGELALSA